MFVVELFHRADPRYLLVAELPERVTVDDLVSWKYGELLLSPPAFTPVDAVYPQSGGAGTDWVRPGTSTRS